MHLNDIWMLCEVKIFQRNLLFSQIQLQIILSIQCSLFSFIQKQQQQQKPIEYDELTQIKNYSRLQYNVNGKHWVSISHWIIHRDPERWRLERKLSIWMEN